jgi:small subunit ribosomal protein S8
MSMTDPIADFLTRLRNAAGAQHDAVVMPSSRLKVELARILREEGYVAGYDVLPPGDDAPFERLRVTLKYTDQRQAVIAGLRRVSRPGRRVYVGAREIPRVMGGMGTTIVSTSRGVMTGHQARAAGVGGEVLAEVR